MITMEDYRDGKLFRYVVMEKRTDRAADYPPDKRNGEWEFQLSTPTSPSTAMKTAIAALPATGGRQSRTLSSRSIS